MVTIQKLATLNFFLHKLLMDNQIFALKQHRELGKIPQRPQMRHLF